MNTAFISDCEGPISKNDNAFELTSHFVPYGDKIFTVISRYDDVLADVLKKPDYKPGTTLKLILPFLKAYGVTDQKMENFSAQNLTLISNVQTTLQYIQTIAPAFIVSTSYEHYIKKLCNFLPFPYQNTYCTKLRIDNFPLENHEKNKLRQLAEEISHMPLFEIPPGSDSLEDFPEEHKRTIERLDRIFWTIIINMEVGVLLDEVHPVGGVEKADAIEDAATRAGLHLSNVLYVGDSITDVDAFSLVKKNGGLTVSFNGNEYAIENAEIAVLSQTSLITAVIVDLFSTYGRQETLNLLKNWAPEMLKKSNLDSSLLNSLLTTYPNELPKVEVITEDNKRSLAEESTKFRKEVRGEGVGRLG
ncbi:MAG: hypothetical protein ACOC6H_02700 [Thermoproteota archaeon]